MNIKKTPKFYKTHENLFNNKTEIFYVYYNGETKTSWVVCPKIRMTLKVNGMFGTIVLDEEDKKDKVYAGKIAHTTYPSTDLSMEITEQEFLEAEKNSLRNEEIN